MKNLIIILTLMSVSIFIPLVVVATLFLLALQLVFLILNIIQ
jgi:hypothetical protein